jgi:hypothetical protein
MSRVNWHVYSIVSTQTIYTDALDQASKTTFNGIAGHLWVPNSIVEFDHVINDIMSPVHRDPIWLALTDQAAEGKWVYTAGPEKGTDISDLAWWSGGEPNGGVRENCAVHWPGSTNLGDASCFDFRLKFIIEFECPFGQVFNQHGFCYGSFLNTSRFGISSYPILLSPTRCQLCVRELVRGWWMAAGPIC